MTRILTRERSRYEWMGRGRKWNSVSEEICYGESFGEVGIEGHTCYGGKPAPLDRYT